MAKGNVIIVKEFINLGASKPVLMGDMNEFWKACSSEERVQFAKEALTLHPEIDPGNPLITPVLEPTL